MTTQTSEQWHIDNGVEDWIFPGTYQEARAWARRHAVGATITKFHA